VDVKLATTADVWANLGVADGLDLCQRNVATVIEAKNLKRLNGGDSSLRSE
jgi:hypothetical protein